MQRIVFLYNLFSKDTSKPPNPDKRRKIRIFGVMNPMNTKAKGYIIGSIAAADEDEGCEAVSSLMNRRTQISPQLAGVAYIEFLFCIRVQ